MAVLDLDRGIYAPSTGSPRPPWPAASRPPRPDRQPPRASGRGPPAPLHCVALRLARPRRHGDTNRDERLLAVATGLEMRPNRDADRDAGADLDPLLPLAEPPPHPSPPGDEAPELLNSAVRH